MRRREIEWPPNSAARRQQLSTLRPAGQLAIGKQRGTVILRENKLQKRE